VLRHLPTCTLRHASHTDNQAVADSKIRVSVVGLSAEMYVLKYMCDACEGVYSVAGDGEHLKQLLHTHIPGPPSDKQEYSVAPFIQMGFPSKVRSNLPMYVVVCSTESRCSPAAIIFTPHQHIAHPISSILNNLCMAVPGRESLVHEAFACPRCEALSVDVCRCLHRPHALVAPSLT
jgi:hypothetical protein